ncbi:hypothetical protein C5D04_10075 [Rathayibacter sp. AY1D2]|uniref:hypothetical protein n=1 Tax=unclassified Rathayibacter TaxID=2609250 RepID=UPI000CE82FB6|nr:MULTISPECIES: hypothetical protein [unclassified Rathayibacter]PPI13315.1 hypothetical protein C5D04_10075 [Rathayibacter sp. AY1D2]PPG79278.1 hypothetical protein C5C52_12620 [Rathayibacter sp. AY1E5]PPH18452.1 hypothetical protein C5C99_13685 [Rathayibacter sp. AY1C4]PPH27137.1 hypothetical protein C5C37_14410 [Rathayibacter sp. AY1F9]PPH43733.1 hypothetical protein C5D09_14575 [Rathayibacter sp. AY1C9]
MSVSIAGLLSACSPPAAPPTAENSQAQTPAVSTSSDAAEGSPAPAASATEAAPVDAEPAPAPSVEADTLATATAAVTAFCRPSLDYDTWIAELYPFLSQQAAVAYETVDPANVPCTTVIGAASVRDGDGAFTMRIRVPTDAGEYSVYVHRTVETGPWAVEQITPLASE